MNGKAEYQKLETCSLLDDTALNSDFNETITSSSSSSNINDNNKQSVPHNENDCSSTAQQQATAWQHVAATLFTTFSKQLIRLNGTNGYKRHLRNNLLRAWSWKRFTRKLLITLTGLTLLILLVKLYFPMGSDDHIPVLRYSEEPGLNEQRRVDLDFRGIIATKLTAKIDEKTKLSDIRRPLSGVVDAEPASVAPLKPITINVTIHTFPPSAYLSNNNDTKNFINGITTKPTSNTSDVNDSQATTNKHLDESMHMLNFDNLTLSPSPTPPPGYLVWSESCQMPDLDPYLPEIMRLFKRKKYEPCSTLKPLTHVQFLDETQRYAIFINKESLESYTKTGVVSCCYHSIERKGVGKNADKKVSLSKCTDFKNGTQLEPTIDNILVKCRTQEKQVYINGHAMIPTRPDIRKRLKEWRSKSTNESRTNATSVLMIGIDSISRINLIRAMPKTAQYLHNNEWFEMSGYNKIDDNTFPSFMAVLAGYSNRIAYKKCPSTKLRALDNCSLIWKTFREHGYVTAYAEDEVKINTFNYLKVGFEKPPVDYYLRPFLLGAEHNLPSKTHSLLTPCVGMQKAADFVYNYALELAKRYKNDPYFGLFWTNSFSHNGISEPSAMDEHMVAYLESFAEQGTLNSTIVIFFSDHGLRFGPTRNTYSGHLEERLPFLFIWLPPHLKHAHPEFVKALSINKNRLTNPYDLHMTLKHVLAMSGRVSEPQHLAPAEACERCQTLFAPVPHNRSCSEIAIEDHWCTCIPYQRVYNTEKIVQKLAQHSVDYINNLVSSSRNGYFVKLCQPLHLGSVYHAYRSLPLGVHNQNSNSSIETYRINFNTKPNNGQFEVTIRYNVSSGDSKVTGQISRLNAYVYDSYCVGDGAIKKYCSCRRKRG